LLPSLTTIISMFLYVWFLIELIDEINVRPEL
jgi:hypothetical protein